MPTHARTKSTVNPSTASTVIGPSPVTPAVTAITLSQTDLEKIEVLDHGKNNWGIWSDKMENYLLLKHGGGYILRLIMCPDPSIDPASTSHWDLNNLCIIAALRTCSSSEEQEFLRPFTNAYLAWNALKSRHKKVGPIAQILLIQQALTVRYRRSERLATTSTQLSEVVRRIYAIGLPQEDDFLTIMMLNAMSDDLPHVRNHIADALATSTATSIYGPSNIHSRLDIEQQLIDTAKGQSGDVALLANGKGGNSHGGKSKTCTECGRQGHSYCCTNCNSWGHYAKDCFGKGGSMEGKREEVLARKCAARESNSKGSKPAVKPASTGKPGAVRYDTGGRAYILDGETHEAIYVANPPAAPSSSLSDTDSREFAGLACDTITPAFIRKLSKLDSDELALYSTLDTLQASVDWCECSQPIDFAGITYKAPNQRQRTIVDPSIVPFFLDSGASVHISNTESDFFSLRPIPPRTVSGVGGSSIQALGVGTLRLVVSKGTHITLDHILFIPMATVRLISVSSLCSAHRCVTSFDASSCWVTACSGSRMLSGSLTSRRLYALSGGQLSADHVFLAQRVPDLQSWHRRLGHANYRAVYDLAC